MCSMGAQFSQLPPRRDALIPHVLRANYRTLMWRQPLALTPLRLRDLSNGPEPASCETVELYVALVNALKRPWYSNVPCMPMYGIYISQLLRFARACDGYSDFLACHKRLVRTLLDQGFRYCLLCKKLKQFYRSHHSLIQRYSHSVTQHLREGVDSLVRGWRISILLVGAAVTGTDRLSLYPSSGDWH